MPSYVDQHCIIKKFDPKSFILRKGSTLNNVYLLLDGLVNVLNEFEEGECFIFAQVKPVDILGEIELLAHEPTIAASCMAATKCTTLQIPVRILEKWIKDDKDFYNFITTALAKKNYRTSYNQGIELIYSTEHLLKLYFIKKIDGKIDDNSIIRINNSRQDISDELGISVRSINRAIHNLKSENHVTIIKGKVQISKKQYSAISDSITNIPVQN